jgi:hypothetical protein
MPYNTYELGESFWQLQQDLQGGIAGGSDILDYWDDLLDLSNQQTGWGMTPLTNLFANPGFWGPEGDQWAVSPGEMYRAKESGDISAGLLGSKFRTQTAPELSRKMGSTGFASSGIRPQKSIYQQFEEGIGEIGQETSAAIGDVYETYGEQVSGTLGDIQGAGGFSSEFAGGEIGNIYGEWEDIYSWEDSDDFVAGLTECVDDQLSSMTFSSPNDIFIALDTCRDIGSS